LPLEQLAPLLLELPLSRGADIPVCPAGKNACPTCLDWPAIFGNANPVELEVGFGKGAFLIAVAPIHPEINYVGVEIDRGLQLYVANRVAKRELHNVRLVKADARLFIHDYVATASLRAVHVYFPDPWWKKRHKKRRVFTEAFARECERSLAPAGRLHLATDVEEYFGVMTRLVAERTSLRPVPLPERAPVADDHGNMTNFERTARLQGRTVWGAVYEKLDMPPAGAR
jgi:tRNA (guanine-N7-)-methyltransferase